MNVLCYFWPALCVSSEGCGDACVSTKGCGCTKCASPVRGVGTRVSPLRGVGTLTRLADPAGLLCASPLVINNLIQRAQRNTRRSHRILIRNQNRPRRRARLSLYILQSLSLRFELRIRKIRKPSLDRTACRQRILVDRIKIRYIGLILMNKTSIRPHR